MESEGKMVKAESNFVFTGTVFGVFKVFIINFLLCLITLGIYSPWAIVREANFIADNTTVKGKKITFHGNGGDLFVKLLIWGILSFITLGIYSFWATRNIIRWAVSNITIEGSTAESKFEGSVGGVFVNLLIIGIFTFITLGIYSPWGIIRFAKFICNNSKVSGHEITFSLRGLTLLGYSLLWGILIFITLGIYSFWAERHYIVMFTEHAAIKD